MDLAQDAIEVQVLVIIMELAKVLVRHAQAEMRRQVFVFKGESGRHRRTGAQDEIGPAALPDRLAPWNSTLAARYVSIDGYLRVAVLQKLGRDTVLATEWPVSELDAPGRPAQAVAARGGAQVS